ncbi:hypothetical protein Aduo_018244 [Ancylostoma duodenale]
MLHESEENPDDGIRVLEVSNDPSENGSCLILITPMQLDWLRKFSARGIAVDDTHNVTRYNVRLATVSVADHKNRGLPAAFMLSGTMTTEDVQRLFSEISKTTPRIQSYANKLDAFQRRFSEILAFLDTQGQDGTAKYLRDNYLRRTASWASFGNSGAIMDTTMISERWHLRSKKDFLHRNSNSRADFLVEKYFLDRRLTTAPYRVQQSTRSHRWAVKHFQWKPEKIKATGDRKKRRKLLMGLFDTKYLFASQLKRFDSYKYSCIDSSPISKYISHPFWKWLVNFYPRTGAPSVLTLLGWSLVMGCFLLESVLDYDLTANNVGSKTPIPDWFWMTAVICTFIDYTLDGTVRKQTRRIGASGPTGELFDHGLDSWSTVPFTIMIFSVFGRGDFNVSPVHLLTVLISVTAPWPSVDFSFGGVTLAAFFKTSFYLCCIGSLIMSAYNMWYSYAVNNSFK